MRVIIVPRKDVAADALFLGLSSETRKLARNGVLGHVANENPDWRPGFAFPDYIMAVKGYTACQSTAGTTSS